MAAAVTPKRLRGRDLAAPFHGVRTTASVASVLDLCHAYLPRMSEAQFFSHVAAAVIYGMPLPMTHEHERVLHVAVPAPAYPPRANGVSGHRLAGESRIYRGLPVSDPVSTWCQLAPTLPLADLIVVGDHLVRRKRPLATLEQLNAATAMSTARGIRALRLAVVEVRSGTDSPMETRLRLALVGGGLPEPVIGHTVRDEKGDFVATPDLAYIAERIAIEYEGEKHWSDHRVYVEDIERREALEDAGWLVIRVLAEHLGVRGPLLVRRLRAALEARSTVAGSIDPQ